MSNQSTPNLPPPIGSPQQAEMYLQKLTELIKANKLVVSHTDLQKFDLASIQDHYKMDLESYEIEVSHSKQPDTGKDFYILLFNNIRKIQNNEESCSEKVILAYIHLTVEQFNSFKSAADEWLERRRIEEEAKRFKEAMDPIDKVLGDLETTSVKEAEELKEPDEPRPEADRHLDEKMEGVGPDYFTSTYPPYPQTSN